MSLPSASGSVFVRQLSVLAAAGTVALFAGCGGGDSGDSSGGGDSGSNGGPPAITASTGDQIFKDANCSSCHTLAAAGAKGAIGPNLDNVKPSASVVNDKVTNGDGSMPAFKNRLTAEQITAVSEYVSSVAGQ